MEKHPLHSRRGGGSPRDTSSVVREGRKKRKMSAQVSLFTMWSEEGVSLVASLFSTR